MVPSAQPLPSPHFGRSQTCGDVCVRKKISLSKVWVRNFSEVKGQVGKMFCRKVSRFPARQYKSNKIQAWLVGTRV